MRVIGDYVEDRAIWESNMDEQPRYWRARGTTASDAEEGKQ